MLAQAMRSAASRKSHNIGSFSTRLPKLTTIPTILHFRLIALKSRSGKYYSDICVGVRNKDYVV
jgi:hypothetical protein